MREAKPIDHTERGQQMAQIKKRIAELSGSQARIALLGIVDSLTAKEIADLSETDVEADKWQRFGVLVLNKALDIAETYPPTE